MSCSARSLTLCGGAGSGKSMRAKRMQALLPEGWIKGSGSSSAKVSCAACTVP